MPPRRYVLREANYRQLLDQPPNVAVLPWGATEAHNYHLPHGTDVYEAEHLAVAAAALADGRGARPIVLPAIPFGNDEQQLDQVATVSFRTPTAALVLGDVVRSLHRQGIDRLILLNAHGGNEFRPLIRDLQSRHGGLIVLVNFWQLRPDLIAEIFQDPGDHGGELETALMLHLEPELVQLDQAGPGSRNPMALESTRQPGVWTPRAWSRVHPDTGAGDPRGATAEQGKRYFEAAADAVAGLLVELSAARPGDLPYLGPPDAEPA